MSEAGDKCIGEQVTGEPLQVAPCVVDVLQPLLDVGRYVIAHHNFFGEYLARQVFHCLPESVVKCRFGETDIVGSVTLCRFLGEIGLFSRSHRQRSTHERAR